MILFEFCCLKKTQNWRTIHKHVRTYKKSWETFKLGLLSSHLKTLQLPQPLSNGWESLIEVEAIGHELTGILRSTLVKIHGSFCGKPNK